MINDSFSLMRGGLVYHVLHASGAIKPGKRTTPWVAVLLTGLAMVPLLLGTGLDGTLWGPRVTMPLLGDYATLARFLVAVPLMILMAPGADALLRNAIVQFPRAGLVGAGRRAQFDQVVDKVVALRDSKVPESACFLLAMLPLLLHQRSLGMLQGISDWSMVDGHATFAGLWLNVVAGPVFRFVALIWLWRLCLWTYLLWRLSRIDLDLHPAHPDGAAGLGFLGMAQYRFSALPLAGGFLLAGSCINEIVYLGATLNDLKYLMIGYIVAATVIMVAPLLLMSPKMMAAKRAGLMAYGALGHAAVRAFDRRWIDGHDSGETPFLEANDPSAVTDFSAVYGTLRSMSAVPLTRSNLLWIALPAALPLLPVLFFAMPVDELLKDLVSILA